MRSRSSQPWLAASRRRPGLPLLLVAGLLAACGGGDGTGGEAADIAADPADLIADVPHDQAVIQVRGMGTIRLELLRELAPQTVDNFVALAGAGFYDGTTFHRVIPGFMIQGGDPNSRNHDPRDDGRGGPDWSVPDEFNPMPHVRGTVSMAHAGRGTAGSQFFIVQQDAPHLDGKYTAFARVVEGIDVVDAITRVEIDKFGRYGPRNRPYPGDVVMAEVRIERAAGKDAAAATACRAPASASASEVTVADASRPAVSMCPGSAADASTGVSGGS